MRPILNLQQTLIISMMAAGILPMLVAGIIIHGQAKADLEEITYQSLRGDVVNRKDFLESYVNTIIDQSVSLAEEPTLIQAMRRFDDAFDTLESDVEQSLGHVPFEQSLNAFYETQFLRRLNEKGEATESLSRLMPNSKASQLLQYLYIVDNPSPLGEKDALLDSSSGVAYDRQHKRHHPTFRSFQQRFELYDIFLIEPEKGEVVYSVFKEIDYGTSLFDGPHRKSGLATAARKAMQLDAGEAVMVDFNRYLPSYRDSAAFVATPIHEGDRLIGVLAFQMPLSRMNAVVSTYEGLGETGESLIVGNDYLRRSPSRFSNEETILSEKIESDIVDRAIAGEQGVEQVTFNGSTYLVGFVPVHVGDITWAMMTRVRIDEALASVANLSRTLLIVAGTTACLVAIFALLFGRRLYHTLGGDPSDIYRVAEAIESGDLSETPGDDEKSGAYAAIVRMRDRLRVVLHDAHGIAEQVRTGAAELSEGTAGLNERTEQQAINLEETAAGTEQLTNTVKQNAKSARSANQLAIETRTCATESGQVASKAAGAMQNISTSSERIADVIGVIDEIAFQTNLLALNAAVEAARAGEQGRGFAIVASEVRQLAGRSASAAKEIKELIQDSLKTVQDGTGLVRESGEALEKIIASVAGLTHIVGEITVASDEQAIGIDQINQALIRMDSVTQRNSALVEEATQTSRSMSDHAILLSARISYFSDGQKQTPVLTKNSTALSAKSPLVTGIESIGNRSANSDMPPPVQRSAIYRVSGGEDYLDKI